MLHTRGPGNRERLVTQTSLGPDTSYVKALDDHNQESGTTSWCLSERYGGAHRGSTGPAEPLLRTTELPIWPPLISL